MFEKPWAKLLKGVLVAPRLLAVEPLVQLGVALGAAPVALDTPAAVAQRR